MKIMSFIKNIIDRNYSHFNEERKRNMVVLILLDLMMIFVMGCWSVIFWMLKMPEMFWLDVILLAGFTALFLAIVFLKMEFEKARPLLFTMGGLITGIPPLYYGIDTIVTVHLAFLSLATILLFSRKEKKLFLKYLGSIAAVFLFVVFWNFQYGPMFHVEESTFRVFNIIVALDTLFIALYFTYFFFTENTKFKDLLAEEREKSDLLLLSIFPESIAGRLRNSNVSVADSFDNVTIIFADIVGFTEYSCQMSASELVQMLDEVFSEFDGLLDKYNVEKIKTIGDAYMAVGGLPTPDENHCQNVADLALEINGIIKVKFEAKYDLKMRIGIHTGKAVAGVIGNKKFAYDLWGDSVNIASRFESSGQPEKVHITEDVKNILGDAYLYEDGGEILIKGKGMMRSFFLHEKKKEAKTHSEGLILSGNNFQTVKRQESKWSSDQKTTKRKKSSKETSFFDK